MVVEAARSSSSSSSLFSSVRCAVLVLSILVAWSSTERATAFAFPFAARTGRVAVGSNGDTVDERAFGVVVSSFSSSSSTTRRESTRSNKEGEEILREKIASKNAEIDVRSEARYAVAEGSDIAVDLDDELSSSSSKGVVAVAAANPDDDAARSSDGEKSDDDSTTSATKKETAFEKKMKRLSKTRAYPLFLLEKAANIVDDVVADVSKLLEQSDLQIGSSSSDALNGDSERKSGNKTKERIVVLGTGWGSAAFLKGIDASEFDVTVISPRNFFLFTPMLAGASVGTVEYRSITEPVREINTQASYLEATATDVDTDARTVECESVVCDGNSCTINNFRVEYDRLIVTVGAMTNTFGIPGVREHCCFLKSVEDARRIRTAIVNCFERANLPNLDDEQRERILTFAVIGAGPTGIEFASELRDFVEQDGPKYYPKLLRHVRIKVIEASSSVLAPFDKSLQDAAVERLTRVVSINDPAVADLLPERFALTELLLDSGVEEVAEDVVRLADGRSVPYGLSVWAAGNGPLPVTMRLVDALSDGQEEHRRTARGRIAVDPWLRARGSEGTVYALGDCAVDTERPLPATAQVAAQQGEWLARLFTACGTEARSGTDNDGVAVLLPPRYDDDDGARSLADRVSGFAVNDYEYAAPFQFLNLGILAYTGGGSALAQLQVAPGEKGSVKGKGKVGFGLWRSVYLTKQVSWRNRFLVLTDWVKTQIFGRDITRA